MDNREIAKELLVVARDLTATTKRHSWVSTEKVNISYIIHFKAGTLEKFLNGIKSIESDIKKELARIAKIVKKEGHTSISLPLKIERGPAGDMLCYGEIKFKPSLTFDEAFDLRGEL